jgi:exosortase H (IPTLxxWG-CTERM-specific)
LGYTARFNDPVTAMLRFIFLFLLLLVVLFVAELTPFVERWFIVPFTSVLAEASAWIIHLFDGSTVSHGKLIQNANGSFIVSIERGCNGIEAVIILISAILAFPAPWKHRLLGLGLGFLAVQVLNLVRIVSLFFLGLWSQVWFEWFHLYLWQALIVLDALIVFLVWLRYIPRVPRLRQPDPAAAT